MKRRKPKRTAGDLTGEELAVKVNRIASAAGRGPIGSTREMRSEIAAVLYEAGKRLRRPDPAEASEEKEGAPDWET